jgi:hypothetical protein
VKAHELVALPLETARQLLGEASVSVVETSPPRHVDLVEGGPWRVLRARETEGAWELTVAREQMREQRHNEQRKNKEKQV